MLWPFSFCLSLSLSLCPSPPDPKLLSPAPVYVIHWCSAHPAQPFPSINSWANGSVPSLCALSLSALARLRPSLSLFCVLWTLLLVSLAGSVGRSVGRLFALFSLVPSGSTSGQAGSRDGTAIGARMCVDTGPSVSPSCLCLPPSLCPQPSPGSRQPLLFRSWCQPLRSTSRRTFLSLPALPSSGMLLWSMPGSCRPAPVRTTQRTKQASPPVLDNAEGAPQSRNAARTALGWLQPRAWAHGALPCVALVCWFWGPGGWCGPKNTPEGNSPQTPSDRRAV